MKIKLTLLTLLTLTTACGPDWDPDFYCKGYDPEEASQGVEGQEAYVVNGEEVTEETELSSLALFTKNENGEWDFVCSAVAYRPQVVLTAAHCVVSDELAVVRDIKALPRTRVDDIYVHRNYEKGNEPFWDLAILHLEEPIEGPFPAGIYDPAAGGYEPDFRYFCTGMVAQGYGRTRGTNPRGLYTIPYEIGYASSLFVLETGPVDPTQGLCSGDSGGGLYVFMEGHPWNPEPNYFVAGVASTTTNLDTCTAQTSHTYLESYSMWVFEAIRCMNGGEDRLWPFYIIDGTGYRGTTCEELRKPL